MKMIAVIRGVTGACIIILALITATLFALAVPSPFKQMQLQGISFSAPQATGMGLDWKGVYTALLDDVGVKYLRLAAYWNDIEPSDNVYAFDGLDYQMDEAAKRNARVVLSIGRKLPRWPECHVPEWASALPEQEQQQKVLEILPVIINRYKDHPALEMWQLENEPLLDFGNCPPEDVDFLAAEQVLIRSLDVSHPILVTDSGELNWWFDISKFGDVVGSTMYRTVYSGKRGGLFHYDYIFPSWLYRLKSRYVKILRDKDVFISELQGEPWGSVAFTEMTAEDRNASFSPKRFTQNAAFAKRTQLPRAYWWGAEFWYWEKEINGNSQYWDIAKTVFSK